MAAKSTDDSASNKTSTQQTAKAAVGRGSKTIRKRGLVCKSASKEKQGGAGESGKEVEAPDEVESVEEIEKFLHAMAEKGSLDWKDKPGQPAGGLTIALFSVTLSKCEMFRLFFEILKSNFENKFFKMLHPNYIERPTWFRLCFCSL